MIALVITGQRSAAAAARQVVEGLLVALLVLLPLSYLRAATDPLPPEEAFSARAYRLDDTTIAVEWTIRPNYYLYRDKVRVTPLTPALALGTPQFPPGQKKRDDFFGETEVYFDRLRIAVPVTAARQEAPWQIRVVSQGCWTGGVCYPPLEQELSVAEGPPPEPSLLGRLFGAAVFQGSTPTTASAPLTAAPSAPTAASTPLTTPATVSDPPLAAPPTSATASAPSTTAAPTPSNASRGTDEAGSLATFIAQQNAATVLAAFFGFGLLLAFTPCVFPMIPILSGIIVGQKETPSRARALTLTLVYVLAMALTYAVAGVVAGFSGAMVQTMLQQPAVLVAFALLFVFLALSLFGFYELQLPTGWQTRLNAWAGSQRGGEAAGVAGMGVLSALIVGPCVAPPLVGALLYISQTGDALLGGAALFAMGLGMGAPLLAVGLGARELLPRSGPWLTRVKEAMGVALLALAWWIVRPVLAESLWLFGWGVLAIGVAVALGALEPLPIPVRWTKRLAKISGVVLLAYGVAAVWGGLAGRSDPLQPLGGFATAGTTSDQKGLTFEPVGSLAELQALLAVSHQPVLVDVRADWCVSCLELERLTFPHPEVVPLLAQVRRVKIDVTANRPEDRELLRHFGLFGPPAILLFDPGGNERRELRVTGYLDGPRFAAHLRRWLAP